MFDLIPTEPLEYQVYADFLEENGIILTAAIRKGILPEFIGLKNVYPDYAQGDASGWRAGESYGLGCVMGNTRYGYCPGWANRFKYGEGCGHADGGW